MEKNKKKILAMICAVVALVVVGTTYAFVTRTLTGTKKVTITAGTLSLVLNEGNAITISDALPMYDQVGMIQDKVFNFSIVNNTSNDTDYVLKLSKIDSADELSPSDVKYYLTKEGVGEPALLSSLTDGIIDTGTIVGNDTIDYTLRLWIDSSVTDNAQISGKSLSFKLMLESAQSNSVAIDKEVSIDWISEDGYLETIYADGGLYLVKISDEIVTKENILGLELYLELNNVLSSCGESCIMETTITEEMIGNDIQIDETAGMLSFNNMILFLSTDTMDGGVTASAGVWTMATKSDESDDLIPIVNAFRLGSLPTVKFAGVTKKVSNIREDTFNYSSEGCIMEIDTLQKTCPADASNGIYSMEDDDGPSYFYRGTVDNLVKFGEYTKDYYVYKSGTHEFASLEACKYYDSNCTEDNKLLKYSAGTPMYWKIIRINGDGTIRMLYSGVSPDSEGFENGIGISTYSDSYNEAKYTGYTYDKTTNETASFAKRVLDQWYKNVFEGTKYDSKIAIGKFCSDSSDFGPITLGDSIYNAFGPYKREFANVLNMGNSNPTFKCSNETDANFGGSYNLKVGLITFDEIIAAGGQYVENKSSYIYGTEPYWTMSPHSFDNNHAAVGAYGYGIAGIVSVSSNTIILRPVINLRADIVFKEGTDGSKERPYELAE